MPVFVLPHPAMWNILWHCYNWFATLSGQHFFGSLVFLKQYKDRTEQPSGESADFPTLTCLVCVWQRRVLFWRKCWVLVNVVLSHVALASLSLSQPRVCSVNIQYVLSKAVAFVASPPPHSAWCGLTAVHCGYRSAAAEVIWAGMRPHHITHIKNECVWMRTASGCLLTATVSCTGGPCVFSIIGVSCVTRTD